MFDGDDTGRRDFLKCMAWAGTGALFAVSGGVSTSIGLDAALAAPLKRTAATTVPEGSPIRETGVGRATLRPCPT